MKWEVLSLDNAKKLAANWSVSLYDRPGDEFHVLCEERYPLVIVVARDGKISDCISRKGKACPARALEEIVKFADEKGLEMGLREATADAIASERPPKKWFKKMEREIGKNMPDYSDEQIAQTIGDIWYHRISDSKRAEIRQRYAESAVEAAQNPAMRELIKNLYVIIGNKRYLNEIDSLLSKLSPNEMESQAIHLLIRDLRMLSTAKKDTFGLNF